MTRTDAAAAYDDKYPTCELTYAKFRLYSETLDPDAISRTLGIAPTSTQRRGEIRNPNGRRPVKLKLNGWFINSSESSVESLDLRRHLDYLLDAICPVTTEIQSLLDGNVAWADICCVWYSASGHGGPTLSQSQLLRLGSLGIDCWFDVYLPGLEEALRRKTSTPV